MNKLPFYRYQTGLKAYAVFTGYFWLLKALSKHNFDPDTSLIVNNY